MQKYAAGALRQFAHQLLIAAGLCDDMASAVAETLVEADLLGHDTHGLALLPGYLRELEAGVMNKSGAQRVIEERAASALWDGARLPGPWLTRLVM